MSQDQPDPSPLTWIGSQRSLARRVARPVRDFMQIEAAGGIVLVAATVIALLWANSPWADSYQDLLHGHIDIEIGSLIHLDEPVEAWVNDALMTIFFFVVGIEIKRELVVGELRDKRAAALPAVAAVGGMAVPALVYVAFNAGGEGADGWGIPMATDIAFTLGVVSLLGSRVPSAMKVFLLTLAIVDDIGAIAVIAVFYTERLSLPWLLAALVLMFVVMLMQRQRIWYIPAYVVVGAVLWLAVFESGVHATIAGVVLGLITPARPLRTESLENEPHLARVLAGDTDVGVVRRASFEIRERVSVAERIEDVLHPFTSFFIVPVFALVNAGIELNGDILRDAASSPITLGVGAGLVFGKFVGVSLFTFVGVKSGLARLPRGAGWTHVVGLAAVSGIGFTVSLFITSLAFDDRGLIDEAKIGILGASLVAALIGAFVLSRAREVIEVDMAAPGATK